MKHIKNLKDFLNENLNPENDLLDLAKNYDYDDFLDKTDNLSHKYNILYRGMESGDGEYHLSDNIFMTDYIGHARHYGDFVDGIIVGDEKILYFDNAEFDALRKNITPLLLPSFDRYFEEHEEYKDDFIKRLNEIYFDFFNDNKLSDAMYQLEYEEDMVVDFIFNILFNSSDKYTKYSTKKINDFFIPIMMFYAKTKGYNIISFTGSDMGGNDEYVVDNISKYQKISDIWKSVNEINENKFISTYKDFLNETITNKKSPDYPLIFDKTEKTENFYKWFGNSEMVDSENNPLILYHGSKNKFTAFDDRKKGSATDSGMRGRGFYFSSSKGTSQNYGDNILTVYLKIEKLFDMLSFDSIKDICDYLEIDESILYETGDINKGYPWYSVKVSGYFSGVFSDAVRDKGYDGIRHGIEFVVFEPNQIKAIDNDGSFDIDDNNIYS